MGTGLVGLFLRQAAGWMLCVVSPSGAAAASPTTYAATASLRVVALSRQVRRRLQIGSHPFHTEVYLLIVMTFP